jgi:hypothetical protein
VQVVVLPVQQQQVQQQQVQEMELVQPRRLVQVLLVLQEQKPLHRQHRLIQDAHRLEQLYQLQHRSQEVFLQQGKESLYQLCPLKLLVGLHQLQLNLQHS